MKLLAAGVTNIGLKRSQNQDAFLIYDRTGKQSFETIPTASKVNLGIFFAVIDGMGGSAGGQVAARTIRHQALVFVENHPELEPLPLLQGVLQAAHEGCQTIIENNSELNQMGAVASFAVFFQNELFLLHIGDTRLYLLREGQFRCLTEDQTLVQDMYKKGEIAREQMQTHRLRNFVSQAIGPNKELQPFSKRIRLNQGDRILACSDGLHGYCLETEIQKILDSNHSLTQINKELIWLANSKGGYDNSTIITFEIVDI